MDQEILNSYSRINHLNVSRETFLDFENYISMILEKNKKINIISQNTASKKAIIDRHIIDSCLLYTSPSPRDMRRSRMPSSA